MGLCEELKQAAQEQEPLKRQLKVALIISDELEKCGSVCVMVGGSAVEFYTLANYLTRDIDLVANRPDDIKRVMTALGFTNDHGTWYLPEYPQVVVEFPPGPLDGQWDRVEVIQEGDKKVRIISVEDILIDRASAVKYWNDPDEWVKYMMVGHYERIDWNYLTSRAKEMNCDEIITRSKRWARLKRKEIEKEGQ